MFKRSDLLLFFYQKNKITNFNFKKYLFIFLFIGYFFQLDQFLNETMYQISHLISKLNF